MPHWPGGGPMPDRPRGIALIGAGGHAKVVADCLAMLGRPVLAYVDPVRADWLAAPHFPVETALYGAHPACDVAVAFVGTSPDALRRRLALLDDLMRAGCSSPYLAHPAAVISPAATLEPGVQVMAGAVVNAFADLARGCVVNTRAIVEHDAAIGAGSHVAPGAIVLGGARVGACCLIGAGAVILPGAVIADNTLVPALTRASS